MGGLVGCRYKSNCPHVGPRPMVGLIGCRYKSNCPQVRPWPMGGECLPWGSFYGIPVRIYPSFRENLGKIRTARSTSVTGDWTRHFPSTSFECRTAQSLVGIRTDSLTSMPYPVFEPGPSVQQPAPLACYTAWSAKKVNGKNLLGTLCSLKKLCVFYFCLEKY